MNKPKVSIIIPVYNVELYLRQCLDSAINQTLPDIQIICVNDGSPDNSLAILQEYADRDPRIKIINRENGGVSSARNAAFPFIEGQYTMFVDADDWLDLDACRKVYQHCEYYDTDILVFDAAVLDAFSKLIRFTSQTPYGVLDHVHEKQQLMQTVFSATWVKAYKTAFLKKTNITFPEEIAFEEDGLFTWQTFVRSGRIVSISDVLYSYRAVRSGSAVSAQTRKHLSNFIQVMYFVRQDLEALGIFDKYKDSYHAWKVNRIYNIYQWIKNDIPAHEREEVIQNAMNADDLEFLSKNQSISPHYRDFFLALSGDANAQKRVSSKNLRFRKISEKIFSLKNEERHKIITLFGIRIKLKNKMNALKSEIGEIKREISAMRSEISATRSEISTIRSELSTRMS